MFPLDDSFYQAAWGRTRAFILRENIAATTSTGLRTTVNVIRRCCETGRQVADDFKTTLRVLFDHILPKWNDRAAPEWFGQLLMRGS